MRPSLIWSHLSSYLLLLFKSLFDPTFEENGINMLGMVFLFMRVSILTIEIIVFKKQLFCPNEDIDSSYFTSDHFLQISGNLKIVNLAMLWTKLSALWTLFFTAENVTRTIHAWLIIPHSKIVPNSYESS